MSKNNRDNFDQCTALVLDLLYKTFPQETDVVIDELAEPFDEEITDNYFATLRFLQREGLIRYQEFYYNAFKGVVLTAKGLKILDTTENFSQLDKTMAQKISQALDNKSKSAIRTVIQEVVMLAA